MNESDIILYTNPEGHVRVEVYYEDETFWLSQKKMAALFDKDVRTINEHLKNIFSSGKLDPASTIRKFRIVQKEGEREVTREVDFYNLDAVISVGYRVNSYQATQFRKWATKTLREFIIKVTLSFHGPSPSINSGPPLRLRPPLYSGLRSESCCFGIAQGPTPLLAD